jgi:uncharacterized damage-inducible protein DinB
MGRELCTILLSKIEEQIERTDRLIGLLPAGHLDWRPAIRQAFSAGVLIGHLLECLAGFCAVLLAAEPQRLGHFADLRRLPTNHRCDPTEARQRIGTYRARIQEGFALLQDSDLARRVPTVFVSGGEAVLMLLLGNLEHLVNHKHQLFVYLQQIGVEVGSEDLYHFRGKGHGE